MCSGIDAVMVECYDAVIFDAGYWLLVKLVKPVKLCT